MGKTSRRNQKVYNMRGCSKTRKNYLGGSPDAPLAYTGKPTPSTPNPFLAYVGKGGSSCGLSNPGNIPVNTNSANPAYPNTGPVIKPDTIFNNASAQLGGSCSSCSAPIMRGGSCGCGLPLMSGGRRRRKGGCGPLCAMGFMVGGKRHRVGCKCSKCKKVMRGGNAGIPYPNGLVGSPWTPGNIGGWPGVDGISGNRNESVFNMLYVDPQTAMKATGNPPFSGGKRRQKGGTLSNFIGQDLINLGRQFQFGVGSAYNALAGYSAPVNPMPWRDQFPNRTPLTPSAL